MIASPETATSVRSGRFRAYLAAEFFGVLNDNAWRIALQATVLREVTAGARQGFLLALAGILFAAPFVLLSSYAGQVADRYPKHRVILALKLVEVLICGILLLSLSSGRYAFLYVGLGLMGGQSALFSPAKYGLLPEVLSDRDLSFGNGLVNLTTFLGMAGGGALGLFIAAGSEHPGLLGALPCLFLASAGALAAVFVPRAPAATPDAQFEPDPFRRHAGDFRIVRADESLPMAIVGTAFFYFLAAFFQMTLLADLDVRFGLGFRGSSALMAALALGIGLGSYLAGRWSDEKIELGLVPLGAVLITLSVILFSLLPAEPALAAAVLFSVGAGAGFFVVPLVSLIQQRSPRESKGRIVAFSNAVNFSSIGLAFALFGLTNGVLQLAPRMMLLAVGLLALISTLIALRMLPLFFVRFTVWLFAHILYRIRVEGRENIPHRGPALLIPNHVSWVDAIIVSSTLQRFIRFMMFRPFYEFRPTHWFFRQAHVIPVAKGDPPERTEASLEQAARELAEGHLVLIFAEGQLTRTGDLSPFRRGYQRILDKLPPDAELAIIPVGLVGLWGSVFSHEGGRFLWKWPRRIPYDVTVRYGTPLPRDTPAEKLQEAVQSLLE